MRNNKHAIEEIDSNLLNLNILDKKDIPIERLSAGQIQKVKLAKTMLCSKWDFCLLDEPETNLDKDGMEVLITCLRNWKEKNKIVVIASHNQKLYEELTPTILRLD